VRILHLIIIVIIIISPLISNTNPDTEREKEITYFPTEENFPNPERGFYDFTRVRVGDDPISLSDLQEVRKNNRSLIIRIYNLDEFRDRPLSDELFDLMNRDFSNMRHTGVKCILTFRYSNSQSEPDAPLERVLQHLDQLQPFLSENYDVVVAVRAGFIGAWGEWHASHYELTTLENKRIILFKLLDVVPKERMVQIRYPSDKMYIYDTREPLAPEQAYDYSHISRTGHHNDCFLASSTDVGTYRISPELEKEYLHLDTRYVAMSGETCRVREGERYRCATALRELEQMRWSYMNVGYYRGTLNTWIEEGCMDEVIIRLGYRLELTRGKYSHSVKRGGEMKFKVDIYNYGWAAPINPRRMEVLLRHKENRDIYYVEMPNDPRLWLGGDTVTVSANLGIPADLPVGEYELLIHFPDPTYRLYGKPEFSIRLANENVWEGNTGFNNLLHTITIEPEVREDTYSGDLLFKRWELSAITNSINN
jgi:hypothetical protein